MNTAVYKYSFPHLRDEATFEMSSASTVVHAGLQGDTVCIWAHVQTDDDSAKVNRRFILRGTGEPLPTTGLYQHVGSFMINDGEFVFHVFEDWGNTINGIVQNVNDAFGALKIEENG